MKTPGLYFTPRLHQKYQYWGLLHMYGERVVVCKDAIGTNVALGAAPWWSCQSTAVLGLNVQVRFQNNLLLLSYNRQGIKMHDKFHKKV